MLLKFKLKGIFSLRRIWLCEQWVIGDLRAYTHMLH